MNSSYVLKGDRTPKIMITTVACSGLAVMLFILFFLIRESLPILAETSLTALLTGKGWYPAYEPPEFGMLPLIAGSISVTLLASLIAVPVSILLAIFIAEICPRGLRECFKPILEILGFFPSVVLGFLGMVILAPWLQETFALLSGLNMFNASLLMGVMILPIVASMAEDALTAVPRDLRDASFAMGATRSETIWRVVVPAALPGIMQAVLLGVMRAIGETMVVLMAAGGAALIPISVMDPVRPLTSAIASEMGETPVGSAHYHVLFFAGLLLLVMTLAINLFALWVEKRGRKWR